MLRERLGEQATFLGWLGGDELPRAYASADVFLFCSRTDTFGQVLVEAGASGLPWSRSTRAAPPRSWSTARRAGSVTPMPAMLAAAFSSSPTPPPGGPSSAARGARRPAPAPGRRSMMQLADGYDRVTEPAEEPRIKLVRAA